MSIIPPPRPLSSGPIGYAFTGDTIPMVQNPVWNSTLLAPPTGYKPTSAPTLATATAAPARGPTVQTPIPMPPVAPPGTITSPLPATNQLPNALQTASAINTANLDYTRHGQQSDPTYAMIQNLLNPNWGPQVYDTGELSAEDAVNLGIPGSNLANFRGARRYADQLTKNALTANTLLTGATGRLPAPFDVGSQLISPWQQSQLAQEEQRLTQQAQLAREAQEQETIRALIAASARQRGYGGSGGGTSPRGAGHGAAVSNVSPGGSAAPVFAPPTPSAPGYGLLTSYTPEDYGAAVPGATYGPTYPDYSFGGGGAGAGNIDFSNFNQNMDFTDFGSGGEGDWWNQPITPDSFDESWYGS